MACRRPILASILGTCASLASVGGAQALSKAEVDKRKAMVENQEAMLEYMLEQQRTVSKAKAVAKEQQVRPPKDPAGVFFPVFSTKLLHHCQESRCHLF